MSKLHKLLSGQLGHSLEPCPPKVHAKVRAITQMPLPGQQAQSGRPGLSWDVGVLLCASTPDVCLSHAANFTRLTGQPQGHPCMVSLKFLSRSASQHLPKRLCRVPCTCPMLLPVLLTKERAQRSKGSALTEICGRSKRGRSTHAYVLAKSLHRLVERHGESRVQLEI